MLKSACFSNQAIGPIGPTHGETWPDWLAPLETLWGGKLVAGGGGGEHSSKVAEVAHGGKGVSLS